MNTPLYRLLQMPAMPAPKLEFRHTKINPVCGHPLSSIRGRVTQHCADCAREALSFDEGAEGENAAEELGEL